MHKLSISFYSIHYDRLCLYSNYLLSPPEYFFFIRHKYQEDIINYYRVIKDELILAR